MKLTQLLALIILFFLSVYLLSGCRQPQQRSAYAWCKKGKTEHIAAGGHTIHNPAASKISK